MLIKCKFCGNYFEDTKLECPICGATNDDVVRTANEAPKTIEELKEFCERRHYPLNEMRFFIGIDYKEPKAFGIYKDLESGDFIVYKNKANGERAIRYRGKDEVYAVNELYQKLKIEIINQKEYQMRKRAQAENVYYKTRYASDDFLESFKKKKQLGCLLGLPAIFVTFFTWFIIFMIIGGLFFSKFDKNNGYYSYNNDNYYYFQGDWYRYDYDVSDWKSTTVPSELGQNFKEYFKSDTYSSSYDFSNFKDTDYYKDYVDSYYSDSDDDDWDRSWDSDWDSDWGSSGWDSSSTDWGSDW